MVIPGFNSEIQILNQTQEHAHSAIFNPVLRSQRPNIEEINFHFNRLKEVAKRRAPHTLPKIHHLHKIVLDHAHGRISDYDALEKIAAVIRGEGLNPSIYHQAKMALDMKHNFFAKQTVHVPQPGKINFPFPNQAPRLPASINRPHPQNVHPFLREFLPHSSPQQRRPAPQPNRPAIQPLNLRKKKRPPIKMSNESPMARLAKHLPPWF